MLRNYLTVAVRNLVRNKGYTAIILLGLGVSFSSAMLILAYVRYELSFESGHKHAEEIYRVVKGVSRSGGATRYVGYAEGVIAKLLPNEVPNILSATRVYRREDGGPWIRVGEKMLQDEFYVVDPAFFDVFTMPLVNGKPTTALSQPNTILVTETAAARYFGTENPIGKIIEVDDVKVGGTYTVTGILQDPPETTYLQPSFVTTSVPQSNFMQTLWHNDQVGAADSGVMQIFLRVLKETDFLHLKQQVTATLGKHARTSKNETITYHLQALKRLHLYSNADFGLRSGGNIQQIVLYGAAATLLILIACINYINLVTARSSRRAREVGVRKAVGARQSYLMAQFLAESVLMALLGTIMAVALAEIALPYFSNTIGRNLSHLFTGSKDVWMLGAVTIGLGLIAGLYPASFMSRQQAAHVLKATTVRAGGSVRFRHILVVSQFALSTALIVGALIVQKQMRFVHEKDLGFDKALVVNLHLFRKDYSLIPRYQAVKQAFLSHPNVLESSASLSLPGVYGRRTMMRDLSAGRDIQMRCVSIDEDFLDLYKIDINQGRNLSARTHGATTPGFGTGTYTSTDPVEGVEILLSEGAVRLLGWDDPLGKQLQVKFGQGAIGSVVGVVRDFHIRSLREKKEPILLYNWQPSFRWLSLKISPHNIPETMDFIQTQWETFLPGRPLEYSFLDTALERRYKRDVIFGHIFTVFFGLAVFVACLGLLGLAAFAAEMRQQEIAVRKVFGASVQSIWLLFIRDFARLILIGNVVAWPIAYLVMASWLEDFAYATTLSFDVFFVGAAIAMGVGLLSISGQIWKAARMNPATTLRSQ